ncbi:hypothetical protein ECO7815_04617, partial [Escherichia coli O55:H7 str. 3256-97]
MNNQDLCLMWLSVWCSILQSMALQPARNMAEHIPPAPNWPAPPPPDKMNN